MTNKHSASNIRLEHLSENSLILIWPEKICSRQHQEIIAHQAKIKQLLNKWLIETIVSYNSLIIYYALDKICSEKFIAKVDQLITTATVMHSPRQTDESTELALLTIPVYYGDDAGWDLNWLAKQCQLTHQEIIHLHSQKTYRAYALGFTPGFCYLGTLDEKLWQPRKKSPRLSVPAGAVAIAEQQSAIYPSSSPGGWHIIGQTPIKMYRVNHTEHSNNAIQVDFTPKISLGQKIRFQPINYQEFCQLGGQLSLISEV